MVTFQGKVVLITGAGSGIGRETALAFAEAGATVVAADWDETGARETVALMGNGIALKVDVSRWDDTEFMVQETVRRFDRLDVLYNNAGINLPQRLTVADTSERDWDRVMAINLKGVFLGSRHALPIMMKQGGGVIVNTGSTAGMYAGPALAAYCTSKGGVVSLTRQLAAEFGPYNIRVNAVCPGTLTKPVKEVDEFLRQTPGALEKRNAWIMQNNPLRRLATSRNIADAVLYLASDAASYVTGVALMVDGGSLIV